MALGPTTTAPQDTAPGSAGEVLARAIAHRDAALDAERQLFIAIGEWADRHTTGALMPDVHGTYGLIDEDKASAWMDRYGMPGADTFLDLAGSGAPEVSDFAITELSTALGRTRQSGRLLVGDVVEAKHRLPKTWARLVAGSVEPWRVRRIAQTTRTLTFEAAAFVDGHVAHVAHSVGLPTIERLVAEAAARFDPETVEMEETDTRAGLHVHLPLGDAALSIGSASAVTIAGLLDRADAEELETALQTLAAQLLADGSTDDLQVRRAKALGLLARGELMAPPVAEQPAPAPAGRRQVVLHVHLTHAALTGVPQVDPQTGKLGIHLARLENHHQTLTADTVRDWLQVPGTHVTVKPVIDLTETIAVDSYEIPDRIAQRVRLTRTTCVFPYCTRPARATETDDRANADLDHLVEWLPPERGGPPGQTSTDNLLTECRHDHRIKTHPSAVPTLVLDRARWRVQRLTHATWLWTSPHGHRYLVHPDGTTPLWPAGPERGAPQSDPPRRSSGRVAGPSSTSPSGLNRDPCSGQS